MAMQLLRQQALFTTPRNWTAESVRHTLSSMKGNRAGGIDGWTPSEMLRLPKKSIEGLAGVFASGGRVSCAPNTDFTNVVALLGKQNGAGEGASTLTGELGQQPPVGRCGERKHRTPEWPVEEVATRNGQPAVCMFLDMEKFYDSVCLCIRIDQALQWHFPKRLLYVAMQAYLSERLLRAGEMVGSIQPSNGTLAGCSLGNRCARVALYHILECVNSKRLTAWLGKSECASWRQTWQLLRPPKREFLPPRTPSHRKNETAP